jgi:uncharacterized protein
MKMSFKLSDNRWSPYLVGALIGVLSWVVFGMMDESLGVSTTFVHAAILLERWISPDHASQLSYFAKTIKSTSLIDWQFAFVIGIFAGSFLSAFLSSSFNTSCVPKIWNRRFGPSRSKRFIGAFIGGVILMFGARLAGGCTSGHGISGGLLLAVSSWLFVISAFAVGISFSFLFYRSD